MLGHGGVDRLTNRRVILVTIAAPVFGNAQPRVEVRRIGWLANLSPSASPLVATLRAEFDAGMRESGYKEKTDYTMEERYSEGRPDRYPALAGELVASGVDVIVSFGTQSTLAAKNATATLPIVMAFVSDPVGSGLAASLARPGSNVTGMSDIAPELAAKLVQLLHEAAPSITKLAVLWNPGFAPHSLALTGIESSARHLNIQLFRIELSTISDADAALRLLESSRANGLIVLQTVAASALASRVVEVAMRLRIPSIFEQKYPTTLGGLMSYGASSTEQFRRAAVYVAKILKGAKPADLPVEQPTRFEFVINMKTAKALGLVIPQTILLRADEVLQ